MKKGRQFVTAHGKIFTASKFYTKDADGRGVSFDTLYDLLEDFPNTKEYAVINQETGGINTSKDITWLTDRK